MTRSILIFVALGAGAFLAWQISGTLLLLFSGLLLAAVIDAAVLGLGRILPLKRGWLLAIVSGIALLLIAILLGLGGYNLWRQLTELWGQLGDGVGDLIGQLGEWGLPVDWIEDENGTLADWLPDPESLFGHAGTAFGLTLGALSDVVVIVLLGLFLAIDPKGYRDSALKLFPPHRRERMSEVLTRTGSTLRWWLVAQLAMMVLIGVSTTILLTIAGLPYAVPLGLLAGLLNFIPFLGPILAAIPLLLALVGEGLATLLWVMGAFMVIQWIEGYLIAPFVQQKVVHLPPALSLSFLAVMAALFGGIGVALATPLLAVVRVLVIELYIKDTLEAPKHS